MFDSKSISKRSAMAANLSYNTPSFATGASSKTSAVGSPLTGAQNTKITPEDGQSSLLQSITLLPPVHRLPIELLIEIFLYCLPSGKREPNSIKPPLLLSQVCSSWRAVALQTPQLWNKISITTYRAYGDCRPEAKHCSSVSLAQSWFRRAGDFPLHFYAVPRSADESAHLVLNDVLLPYSNRFRALHFLFNSADNFSVFFQLPPGHFEQLEHLVVESSLNELVPLPYPITSFELAPRLRRVALSLVNFTLPWAQLTHLAITLFITDTSWSIAFSQCVNLQRGIFYVSAGAPAHDPSLIPPTTLAHLHDIRMTFVGGTATWLEPYDMPALTAFHFCEKRFFQLHTGRLFHQLSSLRSLSLVDLAVVRQGDLFEILRATRRLVELELGVDITLYPLFCALTYSAGQQDILLPNLTAISIHYTREEAALPNDALRFPSHQLIIMVYSRQWKDAVLLACIQRVSLDLKEPIITRAREQFQQWRDEIGLDVDVSYQVDAPWRVPSMEPWA